MKIFESSRSKRVNLPPAILKSLGWKVGDELEVKQVGKTMVIKLKEDKNV